MKKIKNPGVKKMIRSSEKTAKRIKKAEERFCRGKV